MHLAMLHHGKLQHLLGRVTLRAGGTALSSSRATGPSIQCIAIS